MSAEVWASFVEQVIYQCYFRYATWAFLPANIDRIYEAAQSLQETRGGEMSWSSPHRVIRWEDYEIAPDVKMDLWIVGLRSGKVSLFLRGGWWQVGQRVLARLAGR